MTITNNNDLVKAKWSDNKPVDHWDPWGWMDDLENKKYTGHTDINPEWTEEEDKAFKEMEQKQSVRDKSETYLYDAIKVLDECAELMRKKGKDYQGGSVKDHEYYPHGWKSFDTMLSTKILRFRSIMDQEGNVNFDSAEDCLRDLINYASRAVVWLERNK